MFPQIKDNNASAASKPESSPLQHQQHRMKHMWNILNTKMEPQWVRDQKYPELRPPITRSLDMARNNILSARGGGGVLQQ